jgi:DNA polymerase elongation subunit (family B)
LFIIERTGSIQFVRTVYQSIVDSIWDHAVVDGKVVAEDTETTQRRAVEVYRKHLLEMEAKNVPMEEFTYSKGLASAPEKYKNKATPHVQVCLFFQSSLGVRSLDIIHTKRCPWNLQLFHLFKR